MSKGLINFFFRLSFVGVFESTLLIVRIWYDIEAAESGQVVVRPTYVGTLYSSIQKLREKKETEEQVVGQQLLTATDSHIMYDTYNRRGSVRCHKGKGRGKTQTSSSSDKGGKGGRAHVGGSSSRRGKSGEEQKTSRWTGEVAKRKKDEGSFGIVVRYHHTHS